MKTKVELFDVLDGEEEIKTERLVLPKIDFDPTRKIASIFSNDTNLRLDFKMLKGDLANSLLTYYIIKNLDHNEVNLYLVKEDKESMAALILADLAKGYTRSFEHNPLESYKETVLRIGGDIYHDIFITLSNVNGKFENKILGKVEEKEEVNNEDLFGYFKGFGMEQMIAAARFNNYLSGVEERLKSVNDIEELKNLFGAKVYCDTIKKPNIKQEVMDHIFNKEINIKDVFLYAVLQLHKEFLETTNSEVQ